MSNELIGFAIMRSLYTNLQSMSVELMDACEMDNSLASGDWPLDINANPIFPLSPGNYTQFIAPGSIVVMVFLLAVALTSQYFIQGGSHLGIWPQVFLLTSLVDFQFPLPRKKLI